MFKIKSLIKISAILTFSTSLSGCAEGLTITPTYDGGILIKAKKRTPPRIKSMDYFPKSTVKKDDIITFTIVAENNNGELLQYNWKASKGTLLSNSGTTVSWKPERADGTLETGVSTITVTVSDSINTVDASANVFINTGGYVSQKEDIPSPKSEQKPYPIYEKPKPKPYYTPKPSYHYEDNDSYYRNKKRILFAEDFESGFLDDQWSISYEGYGRKNYLTWKKFEDENRNSVVVLTGPTDDVLSNTCGSEVLLTSQAIDLRYVKLPRLTFDVKSNANPSNSVKLNIYWSSEGKKPRSLNVSFIPDKNWDEVNVDLQNMLSEEGGSVGLLSIGATICNNKNEFRGPMIDNIKIFDDAVK